VPVEDISTALGLAFRARVTGPDDGRVVILLHGFPQTSRCWLHQLDALGRAGHRAVAFDQRGYSPGARPTDVEAYKPGRLVEDVLQIADAVGAEQFDLVGHDFGGMVAWMVAGHHPDRVRTLTVASTPHPAAFRSTYRASSERGSASDQHERSQYMRSFRAGDRGAMEASLLADDAAGLRAVFAGLDTGAVDEYVRVLGEPGALVGAFDWYRSMSGRASAATPAAAMPTLYVWSDQDPSLGREAADATAGFVTGPYRFEVLAGVGHWIPELAAARFTSLLLHHLST
jgi:pimeloyl-ACP methyl ester carboxylesterase